MQISEAKKTLATNYAALRKRLFDNFAVFRLDGQRRVFWNPAYVIRKALDMERISNSQVFLGKVLKALKATAWLTNKIYVKNPLDTALSLLRDAVAMDEKSWVPHNALGLVYLTKESPTITHVDQSADAGRVMRQFADHIVDARNLINDVSIPQLQHQLVNLVSFNVTGVASELSIQLLYSIKILQLVSSTMDTNLETLQSAADAGKMVRVSKRLVLDDLFERVDESVPDQMGKYFNLSTLDTQTLQSLQSVKIEDIRDTILRDIVGDQYSEGAVAFEIESYELDQDDDDWFGTVFSAVIGIFQVAASMLHSRLCFANNFSLSVNILDLYRHCAPSQPRKWSVSLKLRLRSDFRRRL